MSGIETTNKAQAHIDAVSKAKNERLDRHSGAAVRGSPKKGGAGKGGWGSYKDDIEDARKGSIDAEEEVKDGNAVEHKIQED